MSGEMACPFQTGWLLFSSNAAGIQPNFHIPHLAVFHEKAEICLFLLLLISAVLRYDLYIK